MILKNPRQNKSESHGLVYQYLYLDDYIVLEQHQDKNNQNKDDEPRVIIIDIMQHE